MIDNYGVCIYIGYNCRINEIYITIKYSTVLIFLTSKNIFKMAYWMWMDFLSNRKWKCSAIYVA